MNNNLRNNTIYIKLPKIFNYKLNIEYLKDHQDGILYHVKDEKIRIAIDTKYGNTLVEIEKDNEFLKVSHLLGKSFQKKTHQQEIIDYIENWFDLKADLEPFYLMGKKDSLLREPIVKYWGLRNIGFPNLFESLVSAIIGQQINIQFAYTLKREFVEAYGETLYYEGERYFIFPSPKRVAQETIDTLISFRATKRKKTYILDVANRMATGILSKESLLRLDSIEAVEKELTKIKGVGPWTATIVAMRCLKYLNALPVADVGLINSIENILGMKRKPTAEEIKEIAKNWEGYESYATFYLWKNLD